MSETTNPFPKEVKSCAICPMQLSNMAEFTLYWLRVEGDQPIGMSELQAEYAARAINQHEKLVAERDLYLELSTIQQDLWSKYRIGPNPVGPLNRMKAIRAKLVALLAGEPKP